MPWRSDKEPSLQKLRSGKTSAVRALDKLRELRELNKIYGRGFGELLKRFLKP